MKLDELEALAKIATPGPYVRPPDWPMWIHNDKGDRVASCVYSGEENAEYIAALSPERVLALIACVRAADAMRPQLGKSLSGSIYDAARITLGHI